MSLAEELNEAKNQQEN